MKEVSENNMYNITVKRNIFTAKSTNKNRKIKRRRKILIKKPETIGELYESE